MLWALSHSGEYSRNVREREKEKITYIKLAKRVQVTLFRRLPNVVDRQKAPPTHPTHKECGRGADTETQRS
jgi:hypothetical protein